MPVEAVVRDIFREAEFEVRGNNIYGNVGFLWLR